MRRDLNIRVTRVSRVLMQLERLRVAARKVSKDEDQVVRAIIYYLGPAESILSKPGMEDDPLVKEINSIGGVRLWVKQKRQTADRLGKPRYRNLVFIYSELKKLVNRYNIYKERTASLRSLPLETDGPGDIIAKTEDRLELIATGLEGIALTMIEPEKSNSPFDQKGLGRLL